MVRWGVQFINILGVNPIKDLKGLRKLIYGNGLIYRFNGKVAPWFVRFW